jgi:hypothetical protein
MSCSILKKNYELFVFVLIYVHNLYNWYPLTIINFISLLMQATHIIYHQTKGYKLYLFFSSLHKFFLHTNYPHHLPPTKGYCINWLW